MRLHLALPFAALAALAGCSGAPAVRSGTGWTLLDTCQAPIVRKSCSEARGADLDRCMANIRSEFDAQPTAAAQHAFVVRHGCPTYIAGQHP
jgi:hypothetical protein